MRRVLVLLVVLIASGARAEGVDVHVVVQMDPEIEALSAAEFRVDNLPEGPCHVTATWNTNLVIGEVSEGISLAFSPPLPGPFAHLGTLHITCFEPLADDYLLCVMESNDSGELVIVDGNFDVIYAYGLAHRFNTDYADWCECYWHDGKADRNFTVFSLLADLDFYASCGQDMPVETTASDTESWGAVKALY